MANPVPPIDYTSKDYSSFVTDMENAISTRLPEWTSRSPGDFGITLIELFAYLGDILSYYGDRIANEAFLATAVQRSSVIRLASLIDYRPHDATGAQVTLRFSLDPSITSTVTIPARTQVTTEPSTSGDPVVFEVDTDVVLVPSTPPVDRSATQGVTYLNEALGTSDGTFDQRFRLFNSPVIEGSVEINIDEGLGPKPWTFFGHLTDASATDPAFTTDTDENGIVSVIFGDNVNGRVPASGSTVTATYRVGGGDIGNVGSGSLTYLVGSFPGVTVTNPTAAFGGAEPETVEHIRTQAPKSLTAQGRAVTLADYASLALKVPGIAKAKAQADVYTAVRLYVQPTGGFLAGGVGGALDDAVASAASALTNAGGTGYLDDKKMINTTVTVLPPQYSGAPGYVPINIQASINVLPQYSRASVANSVKNAVMRVLSFDNVDFGIRVTLSSIYHAINSIEGVDYGVVTALYINGGTPGVADIQIDPTGIPKTDDTITTITATGGLT